MRNLYFLRREKCPACASGKFKTIYQRRYDQPPIKDYLVDFYAQQGMVEFEYLVGATYELCKCAVCGMIFQRDVPNENLMKRLYEHWIDPQKAFFRKNDQATLQYYQQHAQELTQIIAYFERNPSGLSFLDFGMGWGKWAQMAKAFGCDSVGLELSTEKIENAKLHGIKVIVWNEITEQAFDFINTEQVFEHISEPLQTLRQLKIALKAGGIIKISVPTANDINRRLNIMDWKAPKGTRNSLNPVAPLEHINYFTRSSLVMMASKAGMEEVFIPLKIQYRYSTDWGGSFKIAKNIFRPIYRNIFKRQNYVFLRVRQ